MKTWLHLLLFFFPVATCHFGRDKLSPKEAHLNETEIERLLESFNKVRRVGAKEHNAPAMWKLEWSDELTKTAENLPTDCNSLTPGSNYRYALVADQESDVWATEEYTYLYKKDRSYGSRTNFYFLELMNPPQKEVGCARYICNDRKSRIPNNPVPTMDFALICLLGPESTIDTENEKDGEAGSKCEEEGGEDDDGLCVPSGSPGSSILFNISIMASLVLLASMIFD
ncbi:hypothetical protein CAEBREN_08506 [Caenorhabditis brenneri]|uniref:SCP domain-containing protein n=1 Tax=Caenorhabditis brenneri TaxID=135651 RepID=G0PMN1_CAEBE|nr:hypothetical protein CAEBREN_08506 [Caenorhabditis brenneri]